MLGRALSTLTSSTNNSSRHLFNSFSSDSNSSGGSDNENSSLASSAINSRTQMLKPGKIISCSAPDAAQRAQRGKRASIHNAVMGVASSTAIRPSTISDERLRSAAERFDAFRAKLRTLDAALRKHHDALRKAESSRAVLVAAVADAGRGSPIHDLVGRVPNRGDETAEEEIRSYGAVHRDVGDGMSPHLDKLREDTIAYVKEWEKTVSTRIATELRHVRRLHTTFVKRHRKLESLKASAAKKKGGPSEAELAKIDRNESKLRTARKDYRRNLVAVTLLTEEVTDRGWKDLMPVILRLIEFDVETTTRAADLVARLGEVREEMKELGRRYEMDYAGMTGGRLRILLEEDATEFVAPEDMADIESIQPSIGNSSVCTTTYGVPPSAGVNAPQTIKEEEEGEGSSSAASPRSAADFDHLGGGAAAGGTLPSSERSEDEVDDDSLSLDRPDEVEDRRWHPLQPTSGQDLKQPSPPSSPSAPPIDLMTATTQGEQRATEDHAAAEEYHDAAADEVNTAVLRATPPQLLNQDKQKEAPDYDDDQSKINYPTSIYFTEENYKDDVTALTPYPDLVSI